MKVLKSPRRVGASSGNLCLGSLSRGQEGGARGTYRMHQVHVLGSQFMELRGERAWNPIAFRLLVSRK